jgi:hypothetical protein
MSDIELKRKGLALLIDHLGEVDAEKFISLMNKEAFDYTEWQKNLLVDVELKKLSSDAMKFRKASGKK